MTFADLLAAAWASLVLVMAWGAASPTATADRAGRQRGGRPPLACLAGRCADGRRTRCSTSSRT